MQLRIYRDNSKVSGTIHITGSKSESNRLLLLQALYPNLKITGLSNSDDCVLMQKAIQESNFIKNIHHAGTAMRFLTAFFATQQDQEVLLTGSQRMQQRPIKILVDALRQLGACISYEKKKGYPPLRIIGKKITRSELTLQANISSQYISALALIAPSLENGLTINLKEKITSAPYLKMTLELLRKIGAKVAFKENQIKIEPLTEITKEQTFRVESDWSSASYFYSIIALSEAGSSVQLSSYLSNSLQGDAVLVKIYEQLGVKTEFKKDKITLTKTTANIPKRLDLQLADTPDIAQTIAVSCLGLGIGCNLYGLHTLPIKETDRLAAMKQELSKFNAQCIITSESLHLKPSLTLKGDIAINTYNDHRMAMAFAPLAMKAPVVIKDADVASKSYPEFWKDLERLKFICAN